MYFLNDVSIVIENFFNVFCVNSIREMGIVVVFFIIIGRIYSLEKKNSINVIFLILL